MSQYCQLLVRFTWRFALFLFWMQTYSIRIISLFILTTIADWHVLQGTPMLITLIYFNERFRYFKLSLTEKNYSNANAETCMYMHTQSLLHRYFVKTIFSLYDLKFPSIFFMSVGWDVKWCPVSRLTDQLFPTFIEIKTLNCCYFVTCLEFLLGWILHIFNLKIEYAAFWRYCIV